MLCDDVRRVMYFFLDGSLGEKKAKDFASHLTLCPECQTRANAQRRLRVFILARLKPESAPPRLKQRLSRTFRAMQTEWS